MTWLPGHQKVFVFEEQRLRDLVFVSPQSVQAGLVDDVPHDHVRVLRAKMD